MLCVWYRSVCAVCDWYRCVCVHVVQRCVCVHVVQGCVCVCVLYVSGMGMCARPSVVLEVRGQYCGVGSLLQWVLGIQTQVVSLAQQGSLLAC